MLCPNFTITYFAKFAKKTTFGAGCALLHRKLMLTANSQSHMLQPTTNNQSHFSPTAEEEASKGIENLISWIDEESIFDVPMHVFTVFRNINGEINYRSSQNHIEMRTVTIASRQSHCFPAFPSFSSSFFSKRPFMARMARSVQSSFTSLGSACTSRLDM